MKLCSVIQRTGVSLLLLGSLSACAKDSAPAADPVWNRVAHQAQAAGVQEKCLQRVHNLSQFLMAGGQSSGLIHYSPEKPGSHLFAATLGQQGPVGVHLGMMNMAQDATCSASYEIVKVWANTCPQVVQSAYPAYQLKTELAGGTAVLELNPDEQVYAMATPGNGCVTIQKGMVFKAVQ